MGPQKIRNKWFGRLKIWMVVAPMLMAFLGNSVIEQGEKIEPFLFFFAVVFFAGAFFIQNQYSKEFKSAVVPRFLGRYVGDHVFEVSSHIQGSVLDRSGLLRDFDKVQGEDLVIYEKDGYQIEMSDIVTYRKRGSGRDRKNYRLDAGIFIAIKRGEGVFKNKLLVCDEHLEEIFSRGKRLDGVELKEVPLISSERLKRFKIYSDDNLFAAKYLSPSMLVALEELAAKYITEISVTNEMIFIFINGANLKFEPKWVFSETRTTEIRDNVWDTIQLINGTLESVADNKELIKQGK